jgi:hypothetical protein
VTVPNVRGVIWTHAVIKFREQLSIQEEVSRCGELVRYGIEKDFWTMVLVFLSSALLAFDGEETELENINAVTKKYCFASC